MQDLRAWAVRRGGVVTVTLSAWLPEDDRESGSITARAAGAGRVEVRVPPLRASEVCLMDLVPWTESVDVAAAEGAVEIIVNGQAALSVTAGDALPDFVVVARVRGAGLPPEDCAIVPAGSFCGALYAEVFGPAILQQCEAWVAQAGA